MDLECDLINETIKSQKEKKAAYSSLYANFAYHT